MLFIKEDKILIDEKFDNVKVKQIKCEGVSHNAGYIDINPFTNELIFIS